MYDHLYPEIAEGALANISFTTTKWARIYCPYEGGGDLICMKAADRRRFEEEFGDWIGCYLRRE
jgi:hypothetical protein